MNYFLFNDLKPTTWKVLQLAGQGGSASAARVDQRPREQGKGRRTRLRLHRVERWQHMVVGRRLDPLFSCFASKL